MNAILFAKMSLWFCVCRHNWPCEMPKVQFDYHHLHFKKLLWGRYNWSDIKEDVKKIKAFQNKAMRRILGVTMLQVKEDRTTNDEIRSRFNNTPKVEEIWRNRQLLFLGSIARMNKNSCSKKLFSAMHEGRSIVKPFRTTRDYS